jgi:hypothetical protein
MGRGPWAHQAYHRYRGTGDLGYEFCLGKYAYRDSGDLRRGEKAWQAKEREQNKKNERQQAARRKLSDPLFHGFLLKIANHSQKIY